MASSSKKRGRKQIIARGPHARAVVLRGNKEKTPGGLKQADLMKNKRGKIVSKNSNAIGQKAYARIKGWTTSVQKARKALGIKGFAAVKKGSPLYIKAKELHGNKGSRPSSEAK